MYAGHETSCKIGQRNIMRVSGKQMKCIKHSEVTRYKPCPEEGGKYLPETRKYFRLPPDWMLPPFDLKNIPRL
jgi:hypothetical protein